MAYPFVIHVSLLWIDVLRMIAKLLLIVCLAGPMLSHNWLFPGRKIQLIGKSREACSLSGGNYRHPGAQGGRMIVENNCLILQNLPDERWRNKRGGFYECDDPPAGRTRGTAGTSQPPGTG